MTRAGSGSGSTSCSIIDAAPVHLVMQAATLMPVALAVFDAQDVLIFANDAFRRDLDLPAGIGPGIRFAELVGRDVSRGRRSPGEAAHLIERHRRELAANGAFAEERETANGRLLRLFHSALPGGGWVITAQDVTDQRQAEEHLAHLSHHDALTGLGNRALLQLRFEESRRRRNLDALLLIDLDGFKAVNEVHGCATGDALLRIVSVRMTDCLRETDFVARVGSDQFAVLLHRTSRHDGLDSVALRLLRSLSKTFAIGDLDIDIGASIGSAQFAAPDLTLDDLMRRADEALYQAKSYGKGRHMSFERLESAGSSRFRAIR